MKPLILWAFLGLSINSFAFNFTSDFQAGIYWSELPVSAQNFATNQSEGQVLSTLVSQAVSAWEDSVGKEIWDIPGSADVGGSPFGNAIRWSNNFAAETGFNPSTTLAVTVRYRTGTYFSRFEIILNGENTALRNNLSNILYQTILHELGHVIGLDHSPFSKAVMYASLQGNNQLSNDDTSGAVAAINETQRRQEVGFVSELAKGEGEAANALACGSVAFIKGNPPSGPGNGPITVLFGVILAFLLRLVAFGRKKLPIQVAF